MSFLLPPRLLFLLLVLIYPYHICYAFVGGGHAHVSGTGFNSHPFSQGHSHEASFSFKEEAVWWGLLITLFFIYRFVVRLYGYTKLAKKRLADKQQRYIASCRFPTPRAAQIYSVVELKKATSWLQAYVLDELNAMKAYENLIAKNLQLDAISAFNNLQNAWSNQDQEQLLRACSNFKFSSKLCKQTSEMAKLQLYNHIEQTNINECHLIKQFKPQRKKEVVLRFLIKGTQIDEYLPQTLTKPEDKYTARNFSCLLDVIPYSGGFKVYELSFKDHVDDYVMKIYKKLHY